LFLIAQEPSSAQEASSATTFLSSAPPITTLLPCDYPPGAGDQGVQSSQSRAFIALQAWKKAITDDPFSILTTWVGPSVCNYKGVFCSPPISGEPSNILVVAGIDLNHANLSGTLVPELGLLYELALFHINTNKFTGTVPSEFANLSLLSRSCSEHSRAHLS
jgi:hypothetical protein